MNDAVKILLVEGEFPPLQVGDCTVVTETQRPGYGVAPFVVLERHDAYPHGLSAGPYNEEHAGTSGDLERATLLQEKARADNLHANCMMLTRERDEARRELARLRKECATCCLQLLDRALFVDDRAAIADLEAGKTDPHVLALVKLGQPYPLDTCTGCGRPAPVNEDGLCAWGCPS